MKNLYFIAIIPPAQICDEITHFKTHITSEFESKAALKTVPHITLIAPFSLQSGQHADLVQKFGNLSFNQRPFELQLKNFGAFKNDKRPVIFVNPVLNDSLKSLQHEMSWYMEDLAEVKLSDYDRDYHPHVTVAFKDLSRPNFEKAWEVYSNKKYSATFNVDAVHLLHHTENKWTVVATRSLL